jgi:hypothetical protein
MAQVLAKEYECLTCYEPIKIAKLDNVPAGQKKKWERFQLDGITPHQCAVNKKEAAKMAAPTTTATTDLSKEIAAIKAQLQTAVMKLESVEKGLQTKK